MSRNRTENPNIASGRIDALENDEIFVFGSNLAGHHGGGAASVAFRKFGAEWGIGVGLTGQKAAGVTANVISFEDSTSAIAGGEFNSTGWCRYYQAIR